MLTLKTWELIDCVTGFYIAFEDGDIKHRPEYLVIWFFLKITCNSGRPHLQAGYPSAFSLNQDAIQHPRKEGGKAAGDVMLS